MLLQEVDVKLLYKTSYTKRVLVLLMGCVIMKYKMAIYVFIPPTINAK